MGDDAITKSLKEAIYRLPREKQLKLAESCREHGGLDETPFDDFEKALGITKVKYDWSR